MRSLHHGGTAAVLVALIVGGCGSITTLNLDGAAGTGGGSGGAASGGAGGMGTSSGGSSVGGSGGATDAGVDGGAILPCSGREPTAGATCLREGLSCEYGTDPRGDSCRNFAMCSGGHWSLKKPDPATCPPFVDAGMCPKNPAGQACGTTDAYCALADGRSCHCTNCLDNPIPRCAADYFWRCSGTSTTAGCPTAPPNIGTVCINDGLTCSYGCGTMDRVCQRDVWVSGAAAPCPVSTRKAKKDIQYLTPTDIHALAAQILSVRLATYEYRDHPLAGRRHLGFVIEDSPELPAVDRDQDMVDLYGYTSMLLAASQTQRDEIALLKHEVRLVKAELNQLSRGTQKRSPTGKGPAPQR